MSGHRIMVDPFVPRPADDEDSDRIVRRKLSDLVLERMQALILGGEIGPGEALPSEHALMQRFGVGRPAVREALQTLQTMGLITISHGERSRVNALTAGRGAAPGGSGGADAAECRAGEPGGAEAGAAALRTRHGARGRAAGDRGGRGGAQGADPVAAGEARRRRRRLFGRTSRSMCILPACRGTGSCRR